MQYLPQRTQQRPLTALDAVVTATITATISHNDVINHSISLVVVAMQPM